MFGYIRPALGALTDDDRKRYRSIYCGLCRSLETRYGLIGKASLNYDMTFLATLLSSLYECPETRSTRRCIPHAVKPHTEAASAAIDYAADMTILLSYYQAMDDAQDEKPHIGRLRMQLLEKAFQTVSFAYPDTISRVQVCMQAIGTLEKDPMPQGEAIAARTGELLGTIFVWKPDFWAPALMTLGSSLGAFVYWLDAALDMEHDKKHGCYNPLTAMGLDARDARPLLIASIAPAAEALESLPLLQDLPILSGTLYQGIWESYNQAMKEGESPDA